ncbi:MAG: hypothetical protein ACP5HW_00740 [Candidatus Micrarchaeia archaeon]
MEEITAEILFDNLQKEKKTGELLPLPTNFYDIVESTLAKLEASSNEENKQFVENFKKLLSQLKERRLQKVLIYLAYNKQLPQPTPKKEEEIYNKIKSIIGMDITARASKKIKINMDLPEVITPSGKKIGPFSKGQIVEIDESSTIDFILQNKIGEIIS